MTIANDLLFLALRNSGVNGVGQAPRNEDLNDAFRILNAWISEQNLERHVSGNRAILPQFPDLTTDVPYWTLFEHVLLTVMAVRLRQIYALPPVQIDVHLAVAALQAFNAINLQVTRPVVSGVPETVRQAVFLALRMAGRLNDKQSVSDDSADVNDAQSLLVMMLAQWQRNRWLVWNERERSVVSTGRTFYTIGPGMDFNIPRPDKIHAAWVRLVTGTPGDAGAGGDPLASLLPFPLGGGANDDGIASHNGVDLPLSIIEAKEDWATIGINDLQSIPSAVFYDSAWPNARLHFWPVPPAGQYEMHIVVKAPLPVYLTLDDELAMPPEYTDAVVKNLALSICASTPGSQPSPLLPGQARASLNTIKMTNSQIPTLSMPAGLAGRGHSTTPFAGRGLDRAWTVGGESVLS